jgi:histidinol phosphatase-like PHP family hydrolase
MALPPFDKAVEIDAYPDRQDLNAELLRLAGKAGCRVSIGTDAHHPWQLGFVDLALAHADLAGVKPEAILNFMDMDSLLSWAAQAREQSRAVG